MERIRTAVIGCGYFGSLHAQRYHRDARCELVAVVDVDADRLRTLAKELSVKAVSDHRWLIGRVDAVSVVVPAPLHYAISRDFLDAGIHVLVEKPITDNLDTAAELIALAQKRGLVLQVGHVENFSSSFRALEKLVKRPLYIESNRLAPWKPRATEVDVVLDLMIHDIGMILGLVRSKVASVHAVGAPVLSHAEDIANARLIFENGCVANVVASRISMKTERKMRIFQPDSYVTCDFVGSVLFRVDRAGDPEREGLAALRPQQHKIPKEDSLENEIAEFLDCVATGRRARVDGEWGREALRVALMISESLRDHRRLVERLSNATSRKA